MKAKYKISCAVGALLSGYLGTTAAYADNNAPVMTASNASAGGIEEVIVTAERREATVQKTPMTIQAFTGDQLEAQNVSDLQDLLKYTPSVTYGNNGPGQG